MSEFGSRVAVFRALVDELPESERGKWEERWASARQQDQAQDDRNRRWDTALQFPARGGQGGG
jgi:hypothetical protein